MPNDDDAPLSSYSDPLYDRLDAISRQIRRWWWMICLVIIIIALGAVVLRMWLHREPLAVGAILAVDAQNASDPAKAEALWKQLADGAEYDPSFRAAACIELAQAALKRGDAIKAREQAKQGEEHAKVAENIGLRLAAALSQAAALAASGDNEGALALYEKTSTAAGARLPAHKFEAELGAARCLESQGKIDDAIARLEPLTTNNDESAQMLTDVATAMFWRLKRTKAEPKVEAAAASASAPAASSATAPQ